MEPLSREALYALVWSEPMLKVAARYEVSSSYMGRVCTRMNVPRPERGYWAKLAVGKAPEIPNLPEARPGDELVWSWSGERVEVAPRLPRPPDHQGLGKGRRPVSGSGTHSLIIGAKAHFETGRASDRNAYLKPFKKLLVDLISTKACLDKALSFANQLFLSLEERGHRVIIAPFSEDLRREDVDEREDSRRHRSYSDLWSPMRCTVAYIGTVPVGLTLVELSEEVEGRYDNGKWIRVSEYGPSKRRRYAVDNGWTSKRDFPTGRLCLQAYSADGRAKWVKRWRESNEQDLASRLPKIVEEMEQDVVTVARLIEEGERKAEQERVIWQAQQNQWRREEEERQAAKRLKESKDGLLQIFNDWVEAMNVEHFLSDMERRIEASEPDTRGVLSERVKRARQLLAVSDPIEKLKNWRSPEEMERR